MKFKKYFVWILMVIAITITVGEIFARYYLGLGTPPLSVTVPKIEYMFKPNQNLYRFGNHIIINQYGMRSTSFASKKDDGEYRIMVFGDSVLNGGNLTDHSELSTTILQDRLNETNKKTIVGNISAGSWGPGNWLAYADKYGFFGADVVVLVISSHDYADNPTFQALNKNTHPTKKPISAFFEGITRYLPRYLPQIGDEGSDKSATFKEKPNEQEVRKGLDDIRSFLKIAKNNSSKVLVLQHWEISEIEKGSAKPGNQLIKEVCESMEIFPISLEPYFRRSIRNGKNPYRDNIHPNQIGQQLINSAILKNLPNPALNSDAKGFRSLRSLHPFAPVSLALGE
jgi:lysophospholipase L1-like esterase